MYSETVLQHFAEPQNVGELEDPDAVGVAGQPGRGNYMVLHLRLAEGRITDCGFLTYGCAPAIAAGSVITGLIKGRPVGEALSLTADDVEQALGGLPLGRKHCAALAVQALSSALEGGNDRGQ